MTNNFPAVPAGFQVSQVSYQAVLPHPEAQAGGPLDFGPGVTAQLSYSVPVLGLVCSFSTPGSFGSFDQSGVEGALANAITGVCEVLAGMSGVPLATLQEEVTVNRTWEWQNGSVTFTTQDTVAYP